MKPGFVISIGFYHVVRFNTHHFVNDCFGPKLGGASAPLAAFHCLGKVLSPALVSLACVPLAALWAQGAFIPFFP